MLAKHGLYKSDGFTLVEVMISLGISGIMLSTLMASWVAFSYNEIHLRTKMEVNLLYDEVNAVLSNETRCTQTLAGQAFDAPVSITEPNGRVIVAEGASVGYMQFTHVQIEDIVDSDLTAGPGNVKYGTLRVIAENSTGKSPVQKSFFISFMESDGLISRCSVRTPLLTAETLDKKICRWVTADPVAYNAIVAVSNVTTNGTSGDDIILGTVDDDIINGGSGNDIICGNGGNDTIDGNDGDDICLAVAPTNCEG